MTTKIPRYRALIVEQQVSPERGPIPAQYKQVVQVFPGTALRAYHYLQALNEGTLQAGIWGDAYPVRVRAISKTREDVLTLEDVERIGRALYAKENEEN